MTKPLYLIYVPGLGDQNPKGQRQLISLWRYWGVEAELFQMNWADQEPWPPKLGRLLKRIDDLLASNRNVGLIGASAGAGAVINAYAARKDKVVGCVLIAGKVNRPNTIGSSYRHKNPSFVSSAQDSVLALQSLNADHRQRILSRYALADETVYKPDSRISGAKNQMVPSIGHFFTIATQLTLGAPSFIRFLKR